MIDCRTWGIILLTLGFIWQLYTLCLLVHLHENVETGMRYSRYMQLFSLTYGNKIMTLLFSFCFSIQISGQELMVQNGYVVVGDKIANWLGLFPIMYLSGGTCVALIVLGGSTSKLFYQIVCPTCTSKPLTTVEWYLVFTCVAVVLSLLPNLNSIAGVSLIGAITAIGYCTLIWVTSVAKGRIPGVSYNPIRAGTQIERVFGVLNAIGIIAFAFRGHNLILEIQVIDNFHLGNYLIIFYQSINWFLFFFNSQCLACENLQTRSKNINFYCF